jgi:D-alanine-D-alanine ligase
MCNKVTGEIWLNEINACPGSLAYFLWEAARPPVLFSHLLEGLIAEGQALSRRMRLPADPTPEDARLFRRK